MAAKKSVKKVAKKAVRRGAAAPAYIKPCKKSFTQTEVLDMLAAKMGPDVTRRMAKSGAEFLTTYVIACLKKGGVGKCKMLGWNFKSVHKPPQKMPAIKKGATVKGFGGVEVISPGRAAFTKPAATRCKALPLAAVKRAVQPDA